VLNYATSWSNHANAGNEDSDGNEGCAVVMKVTGSSALSWYSKPLSSGSSEARASTDTHTVQKAIAIHQMQIEESAGFPAPRSLYTYLKFLLCDYYRKLGVELVLKATIQW
jgi:hypothetical protein